jgi:hypothetical protein
MRKSLILEDKQVQRMLQKIDQGIEKVGGEVMVDIAEWGAERIPDLYLRGPRPKRLVSMPGRTSGELARNIKARPGKGIAGEIYVDNSVKGTGGYQYPRRWEYGSGKRPFLEPFLKQKGREVFQMFERLFKERLERYAR